MRLPNSKNVHLTYCLNIHRGETWEENFAAVREKALAVKRLVAPDKPFGLGLRLSNVASLQLAQPKPLADFRAFLDANALYVFTINGFPYGAFHGTPVKADVYRPDWSDPKRLAYTNRLADILALLLPEGVPGSISTVPLSYKKWDADADAMLANLMACAARLSTVLARTGRHIMLALEPEPDCVIETLDETVAFFSRSPEMLRRHVGVCVDACHLAVEFEDPKEALARLVSAGIPVAKVQLSAAVACPGTRASLARLREFVDPVYLHQVKVRDAGGRIDSYDDLPRALSRRGPAPGEEWRVHFHVPLYFSEYGELRSTGALYTPGLAKLLISGVTPHLEIETYTFDVLPASAREPDIVRSIAREFEWALDWLKI